MAEEQHIPLVAAIYGSLADVEGALNALLADGVPYERTHMGEHAGDDPLRASVSAALPERFWSLAIRPGDDEPQRLKEKLAGYGALSVGTLRSTELERSEAERGSLAWGHFVFESPASTNQQPEASGTSGTTGIASSGAFASGAHVQKEPHP
jgi:hypothetical protein